MRPTTLVLLIIAAVLSLFCVSCSSTADASSKVKLVATAETLGFLKADEAQAISQALALISQAKADTEFGRDLVGTARKIAEVAAKSGRLPAEYALPIQLALALTK